MLRKILNSLLVMIFSSVVISSQPWSKNLKDNEHDFFKVQDAFNNYWDGKELVRGEGWKQFKRWEYFWEQRTFPTGIIPKANDVLNSYKNFVSSSKDNNQFLNLQSDWNEVGPVTMPVNKLNYQSGGLGRVNVVRVHPQNSNIIWVGSAGGGAWSSTDKGQTWEVSKFTDVLSMGISDIAFSPSKPEVMYLSTGDKNGFFMTDEYSTGILKSVDGGKNWGSTTENYKPNDYYMANRIIVHPQDHNLVYAATNKGILRSKDGAATWQNINNTTVFRDLAFKPDNPLVIYAATSGMNQGTSSGRIFRTTDGGDTWTLVNNMSGAARIELAVSETNPNYVYALGAKSNSGSFWGLSKSTDGGATFTTQSTSPNILSIESNGSGSEGQGFYDLALAVSPFNPELIFAGGIHAWVSNNGGKTWKILNHWTGSYNLPYTHADQQNFYFNSSTNELYAANDGGLYVSSDNGVSWKDISNGLAISQLYKIDVSDADPDMIVAGAQDNGSHLYSSKSWAQVNGGDGMQCAIDPINAGYVYTSTQYGNIFRSANGGTSYVRIAGPDLFQGERANWVTPFIINPVNPASIFIGYKNLYKTTNRGASWVKMTSFTSSSAINLLAISEKDTNIMYMAVNKFLYKSINGGSTWTNIFNKTNWVSGIAVDPENPNRVFVTLSGYTQAERVFEINGTQVKNITYNLPNVPASTIIVQKGTSGRLFIGTDIGVLIKSDDFTDSWLVFSEKLPPVVVSDLKINYSSGKLYAGTYGRGVWQTKLYDCNLEKPVIGIIGNTEFCMGDSVVLKANSPYSQFKWSTGDTTSTIVVKNSGFYFVSVKDGSGCSEKSESIALQQLFVPSFTIKSTAGMVLCGENDTISLSVSIGMKDYKWSTGDTTNRITVIEPGYYKISAKTATGCNLFDSVYIPLRPKPAKPNIYQTDNILSTDSAASYKWYVNGNAISNSNTREYIPTENGEYFVISFNEHGCGVSSDIISITTSVNDNYQTELFNISPNPFSSFIRITSNLDINAGEIIISDYLGRKLVTDYINNLSSGQEITLNLESLPVGTYMLLIKTQSNIYSYNIKRLN